MEKKGRISQNLLRAIIAMQFVGFLCICILKYNMDVYTVNYRNLENKSTKVMLCLEELNTVISNHKNIVTTSILFEDADKTSESSREAGFLKEKADILIVESDLALGEFSNFGGMSYFDSLMDSLQAYFNCAEIFFDVKETGGQDFAVYILQNKMIYYLDNATESMDELVAVASENYKTAEALCERSVFYSRIAFFVSLMVFSFATVIFVWYCRKMLANQEMYMEEADAANAAKTVFLSSMSHEIRTPINAVIGLNEMIGRESKDPKILEYSKKIKGSSNILLNLVNDVLDFSKIEAGKMDLINDTYNLKNVILESVNVIGFKAEDKGLDLQIKVDRNTPSFLYGDSGRIKQIIINLLTNAVKYTKKGSVILSVGYEYIDKDSIALSVSVKDTGIGIKPDEIDKLTNPFDRIDEKNNRNIEGTGLGLSIVNNLLRLMNSKLEVESIYGEGSVFSFSLVQKVEKWTKIGEVNLNTEDETSGEKGIGVLHASKATILAVDDNDINRIVIQELLKRTGVKLDLADGGQASFDMCREKKYDVILMDHRMPEIDGVEALHMIRDDGLNKETPIVALTANAFPNMEEYYMGEGFACFVSKPIDSDYLEKVLLRLIPENLLDSEEDIANSVDEEAGVAANGSYELYQMVVKQFVLSHKACRQEILSYFEAMNIKDYTVKVHALKSSARIVGAMELSKEAEYLESCGNEENEAEIQAKTMNLLKHYDEVCDNLDKKYGIIEVVPKIPMDVRAFDELLFIMGESAENFDYDSLDKALEEADRYTIDEALFDKWARLKDAVYAIDREIIMELVKEIRGGLKHEE